MSEKTTTFGSSPGGLERLLGIGVEPASKVERSPDEARAELLQLRLSGTLPLSAALERELPVILGRLRDELLPLAGKPLGEVLLDEETSLDVLEMIKSYGRRMGDSAGSQVDKDVATTIYFAAIASALLFHGRKITSLTYRDLVGAFGTLTEKRWMAPRLCRHFAKARKRCARTAE